MEYFSHDQNHCGENSALFCHWKTWRARSHKKLQIINKRMNKTFLSKMNQIQGLNRVTLKQRETFDGRSKWMLRTRGVCVKTNYEKGIIMRLHFFLEFTNDISFQISIQIWTLGTIFNPWHQVPYIHFHEDKICINFAETKKMCILYEQILHFHSVLISTFKESQAMLSISKVELLLEQDFK